MASRTKLLTVPPGGDLDPGMGKAHEQRLVEQLEWLAERVELLQRTVRELCEERISSLAEAA